MSKKLNENVAVAGTVQEFKSKPVTVEAIQFTGKNGKAVSDFIKERGGAARNGGNWVKFRFGSDWMTIKKGSVVTYEDERLFLLNIDQFRSAFVIGKNNSLI